MSETRTLVQHARDVLYIRQAYEALEADAKAAKAVYEMAQDELWRRMEDEEQGGIPDSRTGINYIKAETHYAQVTDSRALRSWLQENDPDILSEPKFRKVDLNAMVQRHLEDGTPLPPGLDYHTKRYVSMRGAKKHDNDD